MNGNPDVVIITIIDAEMEAVKSVFGISKGQRVIDLNSYVQAVYYTTNIGGFNVFVVRPLDRGNIAVAALTTRVLNEWRPKYLFLVGIAGGVSNVGKLCNTSAGGVRLGDVVFSKWIGYHGYQNIENGETYPRVIPIESPTATLRSIANEIKNDKDWRGLIRTKRPDGKDPERTRALEGIIISGEEVVNDREFARELVCEFYSRESKVAIETEAAGVARAIYETPIKERPSFLVIRGISDFVDKEEGEKTREEWRPYAAEAAAAFAYKVIKELARSKMRYRRSKLQPYLNEAKRLFEEKSPLDGKSLKEYYVVSRTVNVGTETWDEEDKDIRGKGWDFREFIKDQNEWYIVIGGPFGMGKTSYVKYIAYKLAINLNKYQYVPLFVRLGEWSEDEVKNSAVFASNGTPLKRALKDILKANLNALIILDGLDEFSGDARTVYSLILNLRNEYDKRVKFLITTRLNAGFPTKLHISRYIRLLSFTEGQVNEFFRRYGFKGVNYEKLQSWGLSEEEIKKPLFCWMIAAMFSNENLLEEFISIYEKENDKRNTYKRKALLYYLLTNLLLIGKFKKSEEAGKYIERYLEEKEFLRATAALMNFKERISIDELKEWIKALKERFKGKIKFPPSGGSIEPFLTAYFYQHRSERGKIVEFIHKSFQEYFLAEYYYEHIKEGNVDMLNVGVPSELTVNFLQGLVEISKDEKLLGRIGKIDPILREFFDFKKQSENAFRIIHDESLVFSRFMLEDKFINSVSLQIKLKDSKFAETFWLHRWIGLVSLLDERKREEIWRESLVELIQLTSKITPAWLKYLPRVNLIEADLSNANLNGADLSGAYLSDANLSGADLSYANLSEASLEYTRGYPKSTQGIVLGDNDEEVMTALENMGKDIIEVILRDNPELKEVILRNNPKLLPKFWESRNYK